MTNTHVGKARFNYPLLTGNHVPIILSHMLLGDGTNDKKIVIENVLIISGLVSCNNYYYVKAVSYTHLDVYKRQDW